MITPCGFPGSTMTSMKALLSREMDFGLVKNEVHRNFEEVFDMRLRRNSELEVLELAPPS
jgi:lipoate-protein ligase B